MNEAPKIRHVDIHEWDAETIRKLFDANGNLVGMIQTKYLTREEILKIWPDASLFKED